MARNNVLVPESKQAMDAFKMEVANSLNVNLKQGYNGDLTSVKPALSAVKWSSA